MAIGGGGVEALFYRGPITPGDVASWESPGVLIDGGTGGGGSVPASIYLTKNVAYDNASVGAVIGDLSVIGDVGFSFSIIYNPDSLFSISGSSLEVAADLSTFDGMNPVVIRATDGMTTYNNGFVIFVIPFVAQDINFLFNFAQNSHYLGII